MRKIYKLLFAIILCFCFSSTAKADGYYKAIYSNANFTKTEIQPEVEFVLIGSNNKLTVSPKTEFTYEGETKGPSDSWSASSGIFGSRDIQLILNSSADAVRIDFDQNAYKNKKYLYYDIKDGKNKFYLSDLKPASISLDIDMVFELKEVENEYKPVEPGEKVAEYKIDCGKALQFKDSSSVGVFETDPAIIEIYESEDKKGHILRVNGSNFPTETVEGGSINGVLYNLYNFSPTICGWDNVYGSQGVYLFDYLIEDLNTVGSNKSDLTILTIDSKDSKHVYIVSSSKVKDGYVTLVNSDSNTKHKIATSFTMSNEYVKDPSIENDEIYECYYIYDGSDKEKAKFTYNKTKGEDISISEVIYPSHFRKPPVEGKAATEIKEGICPTEIRLCNPNTKDMYFSDTCDGLSLVYQNATFSGELAPSTKFYNSEKYKRLLGDLASPLSDFEPKAMDYNLKLDGKTITLNDIPATDGICKKGACTAPKQQTVTALKNIKEYCVEFERLDKSLYDEIDLTNRMDECTAFDAFYDRLVKEGIIYDLAEGCGFISDDLNDKLVLILDIIKIAGPVLAILFGMWDFTKVLFTGDADKEMKTAGKRFITRIIAAALLFLIPALIKIPLNVAFEDKIDTSNPFCDVVE